MRTKDLGARRRIADPFDLTNRVASLGILTLIIKRGRLGPTFLMHKRSGRFVVGDAVDHVVPAGEFTPSDISLRAVEEDLDLWRNMAREYAEELLGMPDAQGQGGRRLDYVGATPYREMYAALAADKVRVRAFGVGLDPLTFKPELLTVAVFDESVFDAVFPQPLQGSVEGVIIEDIPFNRESVNQYISSPSTRHGAKACLELA